MNTWTIPADVTLPTERGATVHIAVKGVRGSREFRQLLTPRGYEGVYSWFVGDERLCDHEHDEDDDRICDDARSARIPLSPPPVLSALLGKRCETCDGWSDPGIALEGEPCRDCAGTGVELVTLQREGMVTFGNPPQGAGYGHVYLPGRWKLESLWPVLDEDAPSPHPPGPAYVRLNRSGRTFHLSPYTSQEITVLGSPQPGHWVATFTLATA